MSRFAKSHILVTISMLCGCVGVYEIPPDVSDKFGNIPLNGGRTQAITVDPNDSQKIIIATQFGGMWKTTNGGDRWRHLRGLQAVFVRDVQFAPDGQTVIATLARDIQSRNGGGIYVSRNAGNSWTRPSTGAIPTDSRTPDRGGAYGIAFDLEDTDTWYIGTTFGIARSDDNGATWQHFKVDDADGVNASKSQDAAFAVLTLEDGVVLAMLRGGVYRSDDRGANWNEIKNESFAHYWSMGWNKMDRDRDGRSAFILKDYSTLYYYEDDTDTWTTLTLPDGGRSRGPFIRVSAGPVFGADSRAEIDLSNLTTIWIGQGVRMLGALTLSQDFTRGLEPTNWAVFGRAEGIHDDTGDFGVDGELNPVMLGTDGGVFKPTTPAVNSFDSGAPDGSKMNSFLITDLSGTNTSTEDDTQQTTLYFSTQDNAIWSSNDNGRTWPRNDCAEGFHIEVRETADASTPVTVGYGKVGCGPSNNMFSDPHLVNQRAVPDLSTSGASLDKMSQAFYVRPDRWVRTRGASEDGTRGPRVYTSSNDGDGWRRRFDLGVTPLGVYHRTNIHFSPSQASVFLPVTYGQSNADGSPRIGLVRLNNLFANQLDSVGTADVLELPDSGSLVRRATEFDWQVVFGVHPKNAQFIIAPDIVNGQVKMSRDGGSTWQTNWYLTQAATQNGRYLLWDRRESRVQVMQIDYDPYNDNRIFVGTRDAGVICSRDGGVTWRTLKGTGAIRYITGFQFQASGAVLVSAYGRGLWRIKPSRAACTEGTTWLIELPDPPPRDFVPWTDYPGQLVLPEPDDGSDSRPTGRDREGIPVIGGKGTDDSAEELILGENRILILNGRGFDGSSHAPLIVYLDGSEEAFSEFESPDTEGRFVLKIELPGDLDYGEHRLEVVQQGVDREYRSSVWFRKVHLDEHLGKETPEQSGRQDNPWEPLLKQLIEESKDEGKAAN